MALKLLLLYTREGSPNQYLSFYMASGLRAVLGAESVRLTEPRCAVADAVRFGPDALVCLGGEELQFELLAELRPLVETMAVWYTEDPWEEVTNRRTASWFDVVFTNDRSAAARYHHPAVHHLPLGGDPETHFRPPLADEEQYWFDVFFAGLPWPNRSATLRVLKALQARRAVRLIVPESPYAPPSPQDLPLHESGIWLANRDLATLYQRSRITIDLRRTYSGDGTERPGSTPGNRLFEAALSGAFVLAEGGRPELEEYFQVGEEIDTFETPAELEGKIEWYLRNPDRRRRMAKAAQRRALREHSYEARARRLVAALDRPISRAARAPMPGAGPRPGAGQDPTVLFVVHNNSSSPVAGGTEFHTEWLAEGLAGRYRTLMYYCDGTNPSLDVYYLHDLRRKTTRAFRMRRPFEMGTYGDRERNAVFERLLLEEQVDLVHFQHLLYHPFSLVEIAAYYGRPVVVTLQDFYLACQRFNLLDYRGHYCEPATLPWSSCDVCLSATHGLPAGSQARRRMLLERVLARADILQVLSEHERDLFQALYPIPDEKIWVQMVGPVELAPPSRRYERSLGEPLRVGVLGNFAPHKGGDTILRTISHLAHESGIEFHVLGRLDPGGLSAIKPLLGRTVWLYHGYRRADLTRLARRLDVALFASIWPETGCIALTEAFALGLIPVASRVGALGERVRDGMNGLHFAPGNAGEAADKIRLLRDDPALFRRLKEGVYATPTLQAGEVIDCHVKIYEDLLMRYRRSARRLSPPVAVKETASAGPSRFAQARVGSWLSRPLPVSVPPRPSLRSLTQASWKTLKTGGPAALFRRGHLFVRKRFFPAKALEP